MTNRGGASAWGIGVIAFSLSAMPAQAQSGAGLRLQTVAVAPSGVTYVTSAPADHDRLFLVVQDGRVLIKDATGLRSTPFLDLRGAVSNSGEQGLLSIAFHPAYSGNGFFYIAYVDLSGALTVARYSRNPADANLADAGSGTILLTVPHDFGLHYAGQLAFGPDSYLYISSGDGGSYFDSDHRAQSLETRLGKILRVDVNGAAPFTIPPSNPFADASGVKREIWAYGLRNPWRFSFDRQTGDILVGDVGQDYREEIDFQPAGQGGLNYGWPRMEGTRCVDPQNPGVEPVPGCSTAGLTLPILEYPHNKGCAVTGGFRYRGDISGLSGVYLFSDFCSGIVWASRPDSSGAWTFAPLIATQTNITTFGQDNEGRIYVGDHDGRVSEIVSGSPLISISDAPPVMEGNSGSRNAVFTLFLLPASPNPVSVSYQTSSGTATSGTDFTPTSGTVTFPPGSTSATISVPVLGDSILEPDETFFLLLYSAMNAGIVDIGSVGLGTILTDDATLTITDVTAAEGNSGIQPFVFTVTLQRSPGLSAGVTVDYATTNGSALVGQDYDPSSGTLTFPADVATRTISVSVKGDPVFEPSETFGVVLSNATGASIERGSGTGTIENDDAAPSRTFVSAADGVDDADCASRMAPCRTLAYALGPTAIGGEIIVLATGEYDTAPLTIDHDVKVTAPPGVTALLAQGITVDAAAGRVVLKGLTLKGNGDGSALRLLAADLLSIEDTTVDRWAVGLSLENALPSRVVLSRSSFSSNTQGVSDTLATGSSAVEIDDSRFVGNQKGVSISRSHLTVRDAAFAGNETGLKIGPGSSEIQDSIFWMNGTALSALPGGTIGVGRSHIFGNSIGFGAAAGSVFNSSVTNVLRGNGVDSSGVIAVVPER